MSEFMPQGGTPADPNHTGPAHELGDASINGILWFTAILVVVAVAIHLALAAWMGSFYSKEKALIATRPELLDDTVGLYQGPELPDSPNRDKPELVRAQFRRVEGYGWVEPGKVARIPTSRAMDLALQRGFSRGQDPGAGHGHAPPPAAAESRGPSRDELPTPDSAPEGRPPAGAPTDPTGDSTEAEEARSEPEQSRDEQPKAEQPKAEQPKTDSEPSR